METNELRIGNCVYHTTKCENIIGQQVSSIGAILPDMVIFYHGIEAKCANIEPIPLTIEWLLNLGVNKNGNSYWLPLTNLKAEMHFSIFKDVMIAEIYSDFTELIFDQIKYVHQLQNLYHALTGEELLLVNKI